MAGLTNFNLHEIEFELPMWKINALLHLALIKAGAKTEWIVDRGAQKRLRGIAIRSIDHAKALSAEYRKRRAAALSTFQRAEFPA